MSQAGALLEQSSGAEGRLNFGLEDVQECRSEKCNLSQHSLQAIRTQAIQN